MNRKPESRPSWYEELEQPPFAVPQFTPQLKNGVMRRMKTQSPPTRPRFRARIAVVALIAAAGGLLILWQVADPLLEPQGNSMINGSNGTKMAQGWTPHQAYWNGGEKKLEMLPSGSLAVDTPIGAWWNLYENIEQLRGRRIEIQAELEHPKLNLVELASTEIDESMAYDDFTRISAPLRLPLGGRWKFEVEVDDRPYGEIVIDVPEAASPWKQSPAFTVEGKSMIGQPNRFGIIGPSFVEREPKPYELHLWGLSGDAKSGNLTLLGVTENADKPIGLYKDQVETDQEGTHASITTLLSLPAPGQWKIMAFMNQKYAGSVNVEVQSW